MRAPRVPTPRVLAALALLLGSCCTWPAHAVTVPSRTTPVDDAERALAALEIPAPIVTGSGARPFPAPSAANAPAAPGEATPAHAAWQRARVARDAKSKDALTRWFGSGVPKDVRMNAWTGLPHRAWGDSRAIVPAGAGPLTDARAAERAARSWLAANADLWAGDERPGADQLALVKAKRVGATWFLVFQQRQAGVEVVGGRVDLRVTTDGRLALFGSDWMPGVDAYPDAARLPLGVADARARAALGFDATKDRYEGGDRVILPVPTDDGALEYRVVDRVLHRMLEPAALWRTSVDANSGEILARENLARYDTMVGLVSGKVHPNAANDPLVTVPLRNAVIATATDSVFTAADGTYSFPGVSVGTPLTSALRGPFAEVFDNGNSPVVQTVSAPAGDVQNYTWQVPPADSAEADAWYFVHVARQRIKKIEPGFTGLDYRVPVTVNIPSTCNAFWDGVGVNFFHAGGGCANTGTIADVVEHEFGHGRTQFVWAPFSPSGAMHEGLSDYLAATITNQSLIGRGFQGPNTFLRNTQNTRQVNDPACQGEVHCVGNAISGSLWDLRRNLIASLGDSATAIALADSLFHFSGYGGAPWHDDWLLDLLVVDDNDGNLLNGTPHFAQICPAFGGHGIPCPDTVSGAWIAHTPLGDADLSGGPYNVDARMGSFADAFVPGSATLNWRVQSGPWNTVSMAPLGGDQYRGQIPALPGGGRVDYYLSCADAGARTATSPAGAPAALHTFYVGTLTSVFSDDFETDKGWISQIGAAITGRWQRVDPHGTPDPDVPTFLYQPEDDHTANPGHICWVTGDTLAGLPIGADDIDGGCVNLLSPRIDLTGVANAHLSYWRWYTDETAYDDTLLVQASADDGATWVTLEQQEFTQNEWTQHDFDVASRLPLTSTFRFRVRACDVDGGSLVEAALDDFALTTRVYGAVAVGDGPGTGTASRLAFVGGIAPNPVRAGTAAQIAFVVPRSAGHTRLEVIDLAGRRVRMLLDAPLAPGRYTVPWDGATAHGMVARAGVYFVRLSADGVEASTRLVRLD